MLKEADRVVRFTGKEWLHGSVTEVYQSRRGHVGQHDTLYSVLWDGYPQVERGYLECGLQREETTLASSTT